MLVCTSKWFNIGKIIHKLFHTIFKFSTFNIIKISVFFSHNESNYLIWSIILANNSLSQVIKNNDSNLTWVKQLFKRVFIILCLEKRKFIWIRYLVYNY